MELEIQYSLNAKVWQPHKYVILYYTKTARPPVPPQAGSLEGMLEERKGTLASILAEISTAIHERQQLSDGVLKTIGAAYAEVKNKVHELQFFAFASSPVVEKRRSHLEEQLEALGREARQEKLSAWKDVADHRREFRQWFKQYSDLRLRMQMLSTPEPKRRLPPTR